MNKDVADLFNLHILAKNYGWTPDTINNMEDELVNSLLILNNELAVEEEREMKKIKNKGK